MIESSSLLVAIHGPVIGPGTAATSGSSTISGVETTSGTGSGVVSGVVSASGASALLSPLLIFELSPSQPVVAPPSARIAQMRSGRSLDILYIIVSSSWADEAHLE